MKNLLDELKGCFTEDFTQWLLRSNNLKISKNLDYDIYKNLPSDNILVGATQLIEKESLEEIINILIDQPLADYFWYSYPEHGGHLHYSLPNCEVVPGDSLRVDGEKIKSFLREIKLDKLLN